MTAMSNGRVMVVRLSQNAVHSCNQKQLCDIIAYNPCNTNFAEIDIQIENLISQFKEPSFSKCFPECVVSISYMY